jgi:hypothetical protein
MEQKKTIACRNSWLIKAKRKRRVESTDGPLRTVRLLRKGGQACTEQTQGDAKRALNHETIHI